MSKRRRKRSAARHRTAKEVGGHAIGAPQSARKRPTRFTALDLPWEQDKRAQEAVRKHKARGDYDGPNPQGMSCLEIAKIFGVSGELIRLIEHHARKKLADNLGALEDVWEDDVRDREGADDSEPAPVGDWGGRSTSKAHARITIMPVFRRKLRVLPEDTMSAPWQACAPLAAKLKTTACAARWEKANDGPTYPEGFDACHGCAVGEHNHATLTARSVSETNISITEGEAAQ